MSSQQLLPLLLFALVCVYFLCGLLRRHAARLGFLDIPNDRSSHFTPVPRGGGIAFALVFLALLPIQQWHYQDHGDLYLAIYCSGLLITLLGLVDDRKHIPARIRLGFHFIAAACAAYTIFFVKHSAAGYSSPSIWLQMVVIVFLLVWLLNLYNFMDGIDAITATQTVTVSLCAAILSWYQLPQDPSWQILALLAVAVGGFMIWNLPPAKLFMGDSGSAFLGIIIGVLVLHAGQLSTPVFFAWIILLGVYLVDATVTLLRRIFHGQKFYEAHRTHAYQHAALRFGSHGKVSLAVGLINLFWLFPAAFAVAVGVLPGPITVFVAYLPLVALAFHFKAGIGQANA